MIILLIFYLDQDNKFDFYNMKIHVTEYFFMVIKRKAYFMD